MSAQTITETTETTEARLEKMRAIIRRLAEYQEAARLPDTRLVQQFPELGSAKTWRHRLLADNWSSLNIERWHARLLRIAAVLDGRLPDQDFYLLPFTRAVKAYVEALERTRSDRRIAVVLAPNGIGKTTAARWLVAQGRRSRVYVRIRPGWRDREMSLLNGIARAMGADSDARTLAAAEARLITLLSGEPRTLFIDQAHEGGPALMHLLRCLVDETPSRFVYLGYDTGFRRVRTANTDALLEAQAFIGRCLRPLLHYPDGVQQADVTAYLQAAADMSRPIASGLAVRITPVLQQHGNLRLLADAAERALTIAERRPDGAGSAELIVDQICYLAGVDPQLTQPDNQEEL